MNVLIPCHCTKLEHHQAVKIRTRTPEANIEEEVLTPQKYEKYGFQNVVFVDPEIGNSEDGECRKSWHDIPDNSQDIVNPIMCPIFGLGRASVEESSKDVNDLVIQMIRVLKPRKGTLFIAFFRPFGEQEADRMDDNIRELNPDKEKYKIVSQITDISTETKMFISTAYGMRDNYATCMLAIKKIELANGGSRRRRRYRGSRYNTRRRGLKISRK
jgi:hypothetical protein